MWEDLSMKDRASLIKIAVDNGVYDINEIRGSYNQYKNGGYKPSASIRKTITNWEGSSMKTNRSFEAEARDFNGVLPKGALQKLTQQQLDGLYSYSYNVGSGNFKSRVVPILTKYLAGEASTQDVQKAMWASGDTRLRGLARRRAAERRMFGSSPSPTIAQSAIIPGIMQDPNLSSLIYEEAPEIPPLKFSEGITTPDIPNSEELDIEDTIDDTNNSKPDYGSIEQLSNILDMIHTSRSPREININI